MTQTVLDAGYDRYQDLVDRLRRDNDAAERLDISNRAYQRMIAEVVAAFLDAFPEDAPAKVRDVFDAIRTRAAARGLDLPAFEPSEYEGMLAALDALPALFLAESLDTTVDALAAEQRTAGEYLEPTFQGYLSVVMDLVLAFTAAHGDRAWDVLKQVYWEIGVERAERLVDRFNIRGDDFMSLMKVFAFGGAILAAGDRPTTSMEIIERTDKKIVGNVHHCALAKQFARAETEGRLENGGMCMVCWDQLDQAAFTRAGARWKAYEVPKRLAAGDDHCVFVFESE